MDNDLLDNHFKAILLMGQSTSDAFMLAVFSLYDNNNNYDNNPLYSGFKGSECIIGII